MVSNELQDKLEEAILILVNNYGFEPFDVKPFYMFYYDTYIAIDYQEGFAKQVSYSDLFSPESGIMEFVKWKEVPGKLITVSYLGKGLKFSAEETAFHYMVMSTMEEEQKVKYFLDNAILPSV